MQASVQVYCGHFRDRKRTRIPNNAFIPCRNSSWIIAAVKSEDRWLRAPEVVPNGIPSVSLRRACTLSTRSGRARRHTNKVEGMGPKGSGSRSSLHTSYCLEHCECCTLNAKSEKH